MAVEVLPGVGPVVLHPRTKFVSLLGGVAVLHHEQFLELVGLPLREVPLVSIVAPGEQVDRLEASPVQSPRQVGRLAMEPGLLIGHILRRHDVVVRR